MKKIYRPDGAWSGKKLPVELGGTQSGRRKGAVENLGLVTSDQAGKPNGPDLLDEFGVVARNQRPAGVNDPSAPSLNGPLRVYATTTSKYFITNYDTQTAYVVAATGGTVVRTGETLSYTAGTQEGPGSITVNGIVLPITIDPIPVNTPIVTAPSNNATGLLDKVSIVASPFSATQPDTHASSDWQLATDAGFTAIVKSSMGDMVNKTSWQVTGLLPNTDYYLRVRYSGTTYGASKWSTVVKFTTLIRFVPDAPVIMTPADGTSGLAASFQLVGSAFLSRSGDTHAASDWQVVTDADFTTIVKQSLNDAVNKTTWTVTGLSYGTKYYLRARYRGTTYGYSDWSTVNIVTTSGVILLTGDLLGGGGAGQGGAFSGSFSSHFYATAYSGYGGNAAPATSISLPVVSNATIDVALGAGGIGGGPPPVAYGYNTGPASTSGSPSTLSMNGGVVLSAPGGTPGAFNYGSVGNGDHSAWTLVGGGPGQNSKYGQGGPAWGGLGKAPTGGVGAGGSGASCSATDSYCAYAVGGDGGPGYGLLQYPNTYPMPISYTGATYQNTGGFHTFTFATSGQLVFGSFAPNKPTITSPLSNSTGINPATQTYTANAFVSPIGSLHSASDWQIATDQGFTAIIKQSLNDSVNKTTWKPGSLAFNTNYFVRVRYQDAVGAKSDWSTPVSFTTGNFTPNTPSITQAMVTLPYAFAGSASGDAIATAFSSPSPAATFQASEWSITNYNSNYYSVSVTGNNGTSCSLSAWTTSPFGPFNSVIQVRYQDKDGYWSNWSAPVTISVFTENS